MKLKSKCFLKKREGEEKIKRVFLWWPTRFNDEPITRWLEVADVVYSVQKIDKGFEWWTDFHWKWCKKRFATDNDYSNLPFERSILTQDISDTIFDNFGNESKMSLVLDSMVILLFILDWKIGLFSLLIVYIMKLILTLANYSA